MPDNIAELESMLLEMKLITQRLEALSARAAAILLSLSPPTSAQPILRVKESE